MRRFALLVLCAGCATPPRTEPFVATFSIVACDPATKEWGVAVQSKFFAVGSVVPWAEAGIGAVATQSAANVRYGPDALALMRAGKSAREAVDALTAADPGRDRRQLGIVDAQGKSASFTGKWCMEWAGHREGDRFCVQGNILAGEAVVDAMAKAFVEGRGAGGGSLADWLVAALEAGQKAGGDRRGMQSAALLVVRRNAGYGGGNDRFIDLRVDDHPQPITELARLLSIHRSIYGRARPVAGKGD